MTDKEYRQQRMAIKEQIAAYRKHSLELQQEIAGNEREIVSLNWKLTELHNKYIDELETERETL